MLKKFIILFSLVAAIATIVSCSKKEDATPTGTLIITAEDEANNVLDSVSFTLYPDQASWTSRTKAIATKLGDATGSVTFTGISSSSLWVRAATTNGSYNNTGSISTSRNLTNLSTSGTTAKTITLKDVRPDCAKNNGGFLSMVNTTQNVYDVFLVGQTAKVGTLNAGASFPVSFGSTGLVPVGDYTFNFTRTSGSSGLASISKPVTITQCDSSIISIP